MNWGCLSFIILFPAGIFIWAAGEVRRRNAMPPEKLKELEDEEKFGLINENLECIFCHSKNCVRFTKKAYYEGGPDKNSLDGMIYCAAYQRQYTTMREDTFLAAHCMNCGNSWEMFPPEENKSQRTQ